MIMVYYIDAFVSRHICFKGGIDARLEISGVPDGRARVGDLTAGTV